MFDWWDQLLASVEAGVKSGVESGLQAIADTLAPLLQVPEPAAPFQRICLFRPGVDSPLSHKGLTLDAAAWRIEAHWPQVIPLFEIPEAHLLMEVPSAQKGDQLLLCRALVRTATLTDGALMYLSRAQPFGWTFSRTTPLMGNQDWHLCEVPFHLKPENETPGLIKVGIEFTGQGVIWLRDIELLQAPAKLKPITEMMEGFI
ncbi:hypothetical protein L3556_01380 [Candidatus Synechococcus calcipolaris G9]|uniref:Uncharacterized protein n=1 Tax=Candidatus Synechococcus calcipolaris G9 TaxID=1497997 RepID=A0ABT6EUR4_9SYNE|nr:hypothetical protein [Candidatus Synechococcus calcipolaris]MDG2989589.1 hypothetical protein [Candidatus Synechococcus calcipolaris G9]